MSGNKSRTSDKNIQRFNIIRNWWWRNCSNVVDGECKFGFIGRLPDSGRGTRGTELLSSRARIGYQITVITLSATGVGFGIGTGILKISGYFG